MGVRPGQGMEAADIWAQREASEHRTLMAKAVRTKEKGTALLS